MKALYEAKGNSQAELRVTVDGENWKKAQEKAFKKIAQNLQLKGFRKGHAPAELVRKRVNPREVLVEAVDAVAQEAFNFGLEEYKEIRLIDRPLLDVEALDEESVSLLFKLTVYPDVELGDYKAVEYKEDKVSVLKKDVDREIENIRQKHAEEVLKEDYGDDIFYNDDVSADIKALFENEEMIAFTLTEDTVTIIFPEYALAPYSEGILEAEIRTSEAPAFFNGSFIPEN